MGKLVITGLPIGNIEDTSIRMLKQIFESEVILAEDTRVFLRFKQILKNRLVDVIKAAGIKENTAQKVFSYREQNHDRVVGKILELLNEKDVTLVSDSGMPVISDPGFNLVQAVLENGIEIDLVPGPTAFASASIISGLPAEKIVFLGFFPRKRSKIVKLIESYIELPNTLVFYEAPFRVIKTMEVIKENFPEIQVAACKEITKKFQTVYRGRADEVLEQFGSGKIRGEWVICLRQSGESYVKN